MPTTTPRTSPTPVTRTAPGERAPGRRPQGGPPLLAPVLAFAVLTVGYVVVNSSTPHPDASGKEVLAYARDNGSTIELGSLLLFAAATPLALLAAVLYRRLRALGITAPGSAITLVGGVLAAAALSGSALFGWAGGRLPMDADPALARALADLSFLSGGVAYSATFAMLVSGISVTGLMARLLPRPLTWTGLALAAAGVVSMLTLIADPFGYLLPVVRFGGLIWLVITAILLPRTRPSRHQ
ncbi:DUF4386 domain-containing protein [Streptomyces sp. SID8361]|uniref:DUF4386 domain-containing protein n=1 Tax=Streptomyces sp. MnatMP-M27 TaxID=1839768 RepID=UPI00081EA7D5|nr:DUF4386 domain-containing protein [Streptomyces sp. MnatMP-M27]MYU15467.1 DUF4386 domain-containing protein [Streptomyces sp. SID8361]SCG09543.1 hypothetical protein GA0115260_110035 [Streptomyces sp. MnatMP-M27]